MSFNWHDVPYVIANIARMTLHKRESMWISIDSSERPGLSELVLARLSYNWAQGQIRFKYYPAWYKRNPPFEQIVFEVAR